VGNNQHDLDYRITDLERILKGLVDRTLELEEERGQLYSKLAKEQKDVNRLQDERINLTIQYQELNDTRFDHLHKIVKDHDKRLMELERCSLLDAAWEENTDLKTIASQTQKSRKLTSVPPPKSKPPDKEKRSTTKIIAIGGIITGVITALGAAIAGIVKAVFGQ